MISAGDFRNGVTIEYEENIYQVIDFQHVKQARGGGFVRTKFKNIITGGSIEETFRTDEKFQRAHIDRNDMQYLYKERDGSLYHFMDTETFEQFGVSSEIIGDDMKFVKENAVVEVVSHEGNVFEIEAPAIVELEITKTEPGLKGNTSSGATKPATVETGVELTVPLFINMRDVVEVDTRTGEYVGRA